MPEILDHVERLAGAIGPRPAGTEEEHEASEYIAEQLESYGYAAAIEDFAAPTSGNTVRVICTLVAVLSVILSMVTSIMVLPALILCIAAAVIIIMEANGRPVLSPFLKRGVSQNVVAKYQPNGAGGRRRRKIILVARYDSGKVRKDLQGTLLPARPLLNKLALGGLIALPVLMLLRALFFLHATGLIAVIFNIITLVAVIFAAIPVVFSAMHKTAPFNDGAVSNASGVGVLLDVANRIANGADETAEPRVEFAEFDIHGLDAAKAAGVIPEDVDLVYDEEDKQEDEAIAPRLADYSDRVDGDRLASAKDAIAAFTGAPLVSYAPASVADNLVKVDEEPLPAATAEAMGEVFQETTDILEGHAPAPAAAAAAPVEPVIDRELTPLEASLLAEVRALRAAQAAARGEVYYNDEERAAMAAAGQSIEAAGPEGEPVEAEEESRTPIEPIYHIAPQPISNAVPDWYTRAREQAKKPVEEVTTDQRSRYAMALDAADEHAGAFAEAVQGSSDAWSDQWSKPAAEIISDEPVSFEIPEESELHVAAEAGAAAGAVEAAAGAEGAPVQAEAVEAVAVEAAPVDAVAAEVTEAAPFEADMTPIVSYEPLPDQTPEPAMPSWMNEGAAAVQPEAVVESEEIDVVAEPAEAAADAAAGEDVDLGATIAYAPITVDEEEEQQTAPVRQVVRLPEIGENPELEALSESAKQQAPLDDGASKARNLLSGLAPIGATGKIKSVAGRATQPAEEAPAVHIPSSAELRTLLPSLSGPIKPVNAEEEEVVETAEVVEPAVVEPTAESAAAAETVMFTPIEDHVESYADDLDIVEDVDDSDYDTSMTQTGAPAGPGYMEMPKSRGIFGRLFGKKDKKQAETSAQEWLNVDDDFDARTVGRDRGGWESFREESAYGAGEQPAAQPVEQGAAQQPAAQPAVQPMADQAPVDYYQDDYYVDDVQDDGYQDAPRQSAAFPRKAFMANGFQGNARNSISFDNGFDDDGFDDGFDGGNGRRWNGGAFSKLRSGLDGALDGAKNGLGGLKDNVVARTGRGRAEEPVEEYVEGEIVEDGAGEVVESRRERASHRVREAEPVSMSFDEIDEAAVVADEIDQIHGFRKIVNPDIETEVWFVALGSELAGHAGMDAFIKEHASELRGAVIVELDSLGGGDLSIIESEGEFKKIKTSSRMKRVTRKALASFRGTVGTAEMPWGDSSAAYAMQHGVQAMHLAGMDGTKPAGFGEAEDTVDAFEPEKAAEASDFVMETLKNS